MIEAAIFSLIFLIVGLVLGYLLGRNTEINPPRLKPPPLIARGLPPKKNRIPPGYTGAVQPMTPKELREKKEAEGLLNYTNQDEPG